jgi:hypothetical protein
MTRAWLLIFLMAAGAAVCLWFVLSGQYAAGTVYADYSSQRTDRMGTAALYEALSRIQPHVGRNEIPLQSLNVKGSELLILGLQPMALDADYIDEIDALAKAGNRVVIAFAGSGYIFDLARLNEPLWSKWHIRIVDGRPKALHPQDTLHFAPGGGTSVSRQFGTGAVVLIGSSWAFTNAALREDRNTPELTSAIGAPSRILFDETHLGSVDQGSVMGLVRRFRLQGVLAAAILCALLFIWQSSSPFPPERAPLESDTHLAAASAGQGLLNLLSHHIPPERLMTACIAEWKRDRGRLVPADKMAQIENIAAQNLHPLTQWRQIRATLDKKSK